MEVAVDGEIVRPFISILNALNIHVIYIFRLNGYGVLIKAICYAFNKSGIGIYQENTLYVCFFL
ncbi:hypothetical protein NTGHW29_510037 [Candidatus Nitrotoga sp. HW29]|nr:hypothetical protein NTGHW29_510037 [Candidatus Nitrotoga sp. HW29]